MHILGDCGRLDPVAGFQRVGSCRWFPWGFRGVVTSVTPRVCAELEDSSVGTSQGGLDIRVHRGCNGPEACRFRATPMDVTEWLRSLGLEQYAPAFRDHDIDREVLRRLTGEDLRELGVASIGHRRRLLDAIAALTDTPPVPKAPVASVPAVGVAGIAERRQLTVMFTDLVDSTMLSSGLGEVIGAYHRCVADAVGRFDGFLA